MSRIVEIRTGLELQQVRRCLEMAVSSPSWFSLSDIDSDVEGWVWNDGCSLRKRGSKLRRNQPLFSLRLKFAEVEGGTLLEGKFGPDLKALILFAFFTVVFVSIAYGSAAPWQDVSWRTFFSVANLKLVVCVVFLAALSVVVINSWGQLMEGFLVGFVEDTLRDEERKHAMFFKKAAPLQRPQDGGVFIRPRRYR